MPEISRSALATNVPPESELAIAQVAQLRSQIPLLYIMLLLNSAAVAYTHYGLAPDYLTLTVPGLLFAVSAVRMLVWSKPKMPMTAALAAPMLRRTVIVGGVVAALYVWWALALDAYGGPYERAQVALFIALTTIGCACCTVYLPRVALIVVFIVLVPYTVYYLQLGNPVLAAMAVNIVLVAAVMVQVMHNTYRGFVAMVESKGALAKEHMEAQRLGDENRWLAQTDALTGLPNRRFFFAELEELIARSRTLEQRFAIGLLDLDGFKAINDTYGHAFGDRLLGMVGARLAVADLGTSLLARLGGDEFGFLVRCDVAAATLIGQRFCELLAEPFELGDIRVVLGCSSGVAVFPDAGDNANELFDRSDYALYNAKLSRRGNAILFSPDHEIRIRSNRAIEAALQSADLDAELEVHFQPIVDIETGAVVSAEALARWTNPSLGRVGPDQFIAAAEKIGLIHEVTLALYHKALVQAGRLPPEIGLSFNLSALDITSPETVLAVISATRLSGIDTSRITLELTETAAMRNFVVASEALTLMRSLGIQIALDDFGTGYSSLGYLHRLPLDKVKVDRSFVADIDSPAGRQIVTSIIGLCENLSLDCIVEGVETGPQLEQLQTLGCRLAQGYLFAKPMPLNEFNRWYEQRTEPETAALVV